MATDGEIISLEQLAAMARENAISASNNATMIDLAVGKLLKLQSDVESFKSEVNQRLTSNEGAAESASRTALDAEQTALDADRKADTARSEASAARKQVSDHELTKKFADAMTRIADSIIRERLWANGKPANGDEDVEDPRMTIGEGWGDKRGTIMLYFAHHRIDMSVPREGHPGQTMANYWGTVFSKTVRDLRREQDVTRTNTRLKKDQENIYTADLLAMSLKLFRTMYPTWCAHLKPEVA